MGKRGNGEGSIGRRKNGRWMAQYVVHDAEGNRKRKTIYGKTRAEVPNRVGRPMDHNNLYHREYKALLKAAGLAEQGFTFHSLRHTFGTALFKRGEHPKIVQSLLGHASIVQTMDTYSHLLENIGSDAVGGLDEAFG